mmetsp:Transcript_31781/g.78804  ORF Transcript_31781/g.78804 Transcript_31781/m.78804 type:complete len:227 (-) Transcript_31781:207-887(-)
MNSAVYREKRRPHSSRSVTSSPLLPAAVRKAPQATALPCPPVEGSDLRRDGRAQQESARRWRALSHRHQGASALWHQSGSSAVVGTHRNRHPAPSPAPAEPPSPSHPGCAHAGRPQSVHTVPASSLPRDTNGRRRPFSQYPAGNQEARGRGEEGRGHLVLDPRCRTRWQTDTQELPQRRIQPHVSQDAERQQARPIAPPVTASRTPPLSAVGFPATHASRRCEGRR